MRRFNQCATILRGFSRTLLFVLLLGLSLLSSSVISPVSSAWADVQPKPYDTSDMGDRIDAYMETYDDAKYADWRELNWVLYDYEHLSPGRMIFSVWTDAQFSSGVIQDAGPILGTGFEDYTMFSTRVVCSFSKEGGGAQGCNSIGDYGTWTEHIFDMHLNEHGLETASSDVIDEYAFLLTGAGLYPKIFYNVKRFDFSAFHNYEQFGDEPPFGYNVKWTLYDKDSTDVLKTQTSAPITEFKYIFDDYGTYGLDVEFAPAIPYPNLPEEYDYVVGKYQIKVDGTSYVSNSANDSCDDTGACEEAFTMEDCTGYGTDIAGAFGCHIRNFGRSFEVMMIKLFQPAPSYFKYYWTSMTTFLNEKLGFLYQSLASMIGIITGMIGASGTADCTMTPEGEIWGSPLTLDACAINELSPTIWNGLTLLARGAVVITFVYAFQRKYHEVLEAR